MIISMDMVKDVWRFRDFVASSVRREFAARWTGTQLGPLWLLIQPLATILIFTVIFANIMRPGMPAHDSKFAYSIYLCAGILTFNLFSEMLSRCVAVFVENANLLKKIHFPKLCLPVIVMVSSLVNFAVTMALFSGFLLITGAFPGWVILWMVPVVFIQLMFTMGMGMLLACINVFYRDVQQAVQVMLQFWFWLTPIVYLAHTLPGTVQSVMALNPMVPVIRAYQGIFLEHAPPVLSTLVYPLLLGVVFSAAGIWVFHRLQGEIVDEL